MKKLIQLVKRNPLEAILVLIAAELAFLTYVAMLVMEGTDRYERTIFKILMGIYTRP